MKGIILAGGSGTRLHPLTKAVSKQLLPVYDKPMIYYPLSVLMKAGIRDVMVISTPHDLPLFRRLLGDGDRLGMRLWYAEQPKPEGLAQAFLIGREFVDEEPVCLVLGDNLFHDSLGVFDAAVYNAARIERGATIFGVHVSEPQRYGVIEFGQEGLPIDIVEKPSKAPSNVAVPGIYFYDEYVCQYASMLQPSWRGELEITSINRMYLDRDALTVKMLPEDMVWMDMGTHESLSCASFYVSNMQQRLAASIGCLEEVAWRNGWIGRAEVSAEVMAQGNSSYAEYLRDLLIKGVDHGA